MWSIYTFVNDFLSYLGIERRYIMLNEYEKLAEMDNDVRWQEEQDALMLEQAENEQDDIDEKMNAYREMMRDLQFYNS